MKRRVTERVLVLILSIAVLLSSTGIYTVFATQENTIAGSQTVTDSSTVAGESTETEANTQENIVENGGAIETPVLSGEGTAQKPYKIATVDDLFLMQEVINDSTKQDKNFSLVADIDLSGVTAADLAKNSVTPGTLISLNKTLSDATPKSVWFNLDGCGHKIYGLNVTSTEFNNVAIFGYISKNSTVKNLVVEACSVTVENVKATSASVLALFNEGKIRNSTVDGATLNIKSASSGAVAGAIVAENKGAVADLTIKNINVSAACGIKALGAVAGVNNGEINTAKATGISVATSDKNATASAGGVVGVNNSKIKDCAISIASMSYAAEAGGVAGVNAGEINNCSVNGTYDGKSAVAQSDATIIGAETAGAIAGRNEGKVVACSASEVSAFINNGVYGGIAGISGKDSTVNNCVAAGAVAGKGVAGGIVGRAQEGATVKNNYAFVSLMADSARGAVIGEGKASVENNFWSSALSGRFVAYQSGSEQGDMISATRLITVNAGESKAVNLAAFGGEWGVASVSAASIDSVSLSGSGVELKKGENNFTLKALSANKTAKLTYTAKFSVKAGFNNATVVSREMSVAVITLEKDAEGNGLTAETPIKIATSTELGFLKAAPFAYFELAGNVVVPENWKAFAFNGHLNGVGYTVDSDAPLFASVSGEIKNLTVRLNGEIKTAVFGSANSAEFNNVRLIKGQAEEDSKEVIRLLAEKSSVSPFLNKVMGNTVINGCYSEIPVHIANKDVANVAGLIAIVNANAAKITSSGASVTITSEFENKIADSAAFIGKVANNAEGTISGCFGTIESTVVDYALIGAGNKDNFKVENSYFSSHNEKAAPVEFENVVAAKWLFDAGVQGFIAGKGSVVSITLPKEIAQFGAVSAKDFAAKYNPEELKVDTSGITVKDGILYLPVEAADGVITVLNSQVMLVHKPTGLCATIGVSNGLEKDDDGNYIIYYAVDIAFIGENIEKFNGESFKLANDIDMSNLADFRPVGGTVVAFNGTFDGCGHTITGLNVSGTSKAALFGALENATVKNLVIDGAKVAASGSYAGIVAGQLNSNTTIKNVTVTNGTVSVAESFAGGVAGSANGNNIKISDVKVENVTVSALNNAGGVIGFAEGECSVADSGIKSATVTATNFAGGVAGSADSAAINTVSVADSKITAGKNAGGVAGAFAGEIKATQVSASIMGDVAGGFTGATIAGAKAVITNSKANVKIYPDEDAVSAGGFVAVVVNGSELEITGCTVSDSSSIGSSMASGGFIGDVQGKAVVTDSTSYARVEGIQSSTKLSVGAGGVIGKVSSADFADVCIRNVNVGGIVEAYDFAGGIIGNVLCEKSNGIAVSDCVIATEIKTSQVENSGFVIGAINENVVSSVKDAVFSSYGSDLNAYGTVAGEGTYTDLDKYVESSLKNVVTSSDKISIKVSNSKANELGFVFDGKTGWQSESDDRISVVGGNENEVEIIANKPAECALVATYTLKGDSRIALRLHFDIKADIRLALNGAGTQADPYRVSNADELDSVRDYMGEGKYFVLTNNILFSADDFAFGGNFYNEGKGFAPFGTDEIPFNGVFDGAGYTISGVCVNTDEASLFGTIDRAEIKDVNISISASGSQLSAGVATKAYNSKISGVTVSGNVAVSSENGSVAGIVAYSNASELTNVTVENLAVSTVESVGNNCVVYAAGVVARAVDTTLIQIKVNSDVTVKSAVYAAAIVGYGENVIVKVAESYAAVSGEYVGVIFVTVNKNASASDIVASGKADGTSAAAGIVSVADGILNASNIVISAVIDGEVAGMVAGFADEDIYANENSDTKLENIIYSSYQNNAGMFGEASLNSYQLANCAEAFVDVNNVVPADGDFVAVGKEAVKVKDAVKLVFDASGDAQLFTFSGVEFTLSAVSTNPEKLVAFDGEAVVALQTDIDGAQLVMTYSNGIEIAVEMISVKGLVGNGSEKSPYVISNEDTLKLLSVYPSAQFVLSNDITITQDHIPVDSFNGKLDGKGFTIYGLEIDADNAGLFETVAGSAAINNLVFDSADITGVESAGVVAAMVCGNASITNISVTNSTIKAGNSAAAIVGVANSNGNEISACSVSGCTVEAKNAAGIAAVAEGDSLAVSECVVSSDISGENAAAIVAVAESEIVVTDCIADGTVGGTNAESGIIAVVNGELNGKMRVAGNEVSTKLSGEATHSASVVGVFEVLPEDSETFAEMFNNNTVTNGVASFQPEVMKYQNFDGAEVAPEVEITLKGEGTENSPYEIYTVSDFNSIPDGSDAHFVLMNDIVITADDYGISADENGNTVYGALYDGYTPIKDFAGSFDGKGHVIRGLYIDSDADYVGLFANIRANGQVKNVHLEVLEESQGFGFSGITGSAFVGGIAGYCESITGIINCSVEGGVIAGERAVGAIVGELASSKLEGCVATSVVEAEKSAGGLVGVTKGDSIVLRSVTASTVDGDGGTIVGVNDGNLSIKDVLSTGSTKGGNSITVGKNNGELTIEKSIIGGTNAGAMTNSVDADEISFVYSDVTALGTKEADVASVSAGNLMASIPEGLDGWVAQKDCYPAPQMSDKYAVALAKLASIPVIADVKEGAEVVNGFAYPVTINADDVVVSSSVISGEDDLYIDGNKIYNDSFIDEMPHAVISAGEMSRVVLLAQRNNENVLYVSHAKQLMALTNPEGKYAALSKYLNNPKAKIILTADIDFGADALSEENAFTPIVGFTGSVDGNGYSINNLRIDAAKGEAGLFATIGGDAENVARFTDITFDNVYITGRGEAGALAGAAGEYTDISNIRVESSNKSGYVSGATAGAVVGSMAGGTLSGAYADITVDGQNIVGGLLGTSDAVITNSNAYGKVNAAITGSALAGVGGLVGVMNSGAIHTSSSLADVTVSAVANSEDENGVAGVGGLVGIAHGKVEQSFSAGTVKVDGAQVADGKSTVGIGGLVGVAYETIESVYSASAVSVDVIGGTADEAIRAAGGLVGVAYGEISDAYASGGVSATSAGVKAYGSDCFIAGVVGYAYGDTYENLYFDKYMNNDENLTAVSNIISESCHRLTTDELISGAELSSAFVKGEGIYPYLKSMVATTESRTSTALSVVVTLVAEDDASALEGSGVSKAVTLPTEVALGGEAYSLDWLAGDSAVVDGQSAQLNRTKMYADYMTLTLTINGVSKTYSRLYTDVGAVEATLGNTEVEYKLVNESGHNYMDNALVGILIKSRLNDNSVVTSDFFTSCSVPASRMNKLLVTSGGFYVASSLASGYEVKVTAKDRAGNEITVTDAGAQGVFVETENAQSVVLEITIVKKDIPWGLTSLWESLVR